jgi:hypothetical protein
MRTESILDQALARVKRNKDGSIPTDKLIEAVADLITIDVESERKRKARALVDRRTAPGSTEPHGQLVLPLANLEPYPYEPNRLVKAGSSVIEQDRARPEHKTQEWEKARENLRRVEVWERRKAYEVNGYTSWFIAQLKKRRKESELTFGRYLREQGIWREGHAPREEPPDGEPCDD